MKKTEQRKAIARVFAKCFRLGLNDTRLSVFDVCHRIRGSQKDIFKANELFAAWATCKILRDSGRSEDIDLFITVYLKRKQSTTAIAIKRYCDERTLYRRLESVERQYQTIIKSLNTKK